MKGGLDVLFGLSSLLPTSVSELKQMENIEINLNGEIDGTNKDKGDSISRE